MKITWDMKGLDDLEKSIKADWAAGLIPELNEVNSRLGGHPYEEVLPEVTRVTAKYGITGADDWARSIADGIDGFK